MTSDWNRRQWVTALAGAAPALAQEEAVPQNAEQELALARKRRQANAETLEKFKLPMATEPAFRFEA